MASRHLAPPACGANMRRQWRERLAAYRTARHAISTARSGDTTLLEFYGCLCELLLCPAPDLDALAIKPRLAASDIDSVDPAIAVVSAGFAAVPRRLTVPQANS